jgi:hypothetical protein
MSVIRVDNFGPSAGGTTYSARGVAKAWVNFNGTGTIAARDSENVSSLTDNGTGAYTTNLTNNMANANYFASSLTSGDAAAASIAFENNSGANRSSATTGGLAIQTTNNAGSAADRASVNVAIHGDLA